MMRDLGCFGDASVQIADAASSSSGTGGGGRGKAPAAARSRVTCLYHARLAGRPCELSVTWTRAGGLAGQAAAVSVVAVDAASGDRLCRADIKPWLFAKRKGSKSLDVAAAGSTKVDVLWDLSGARFGPAPEPLEGFYVAVVCGGEMVLLLGDMRKEAYRKTGAGRPAGDALLVARREHVVGKKVFSAKAQFCHHGRCHDIVIECDTARANDPCLVIHIDRRPVMRVRRLPWKFRGNQTILVDGLPVEVLWDVHGWLFGPAAATSAVFMFQTCQAPEKSMPWAYLQIFKEHQLQGHGFSLIIHAWKVE
ncbi:uncharacterized protein LOC120659660 [Panicum virgatum]|uniref:Uncharacterized protein n=1 Tax=Panicum virgatum TaxID=38727 RepID=A0A8T0V7N4_PANVG|nr:uncharacterized protein LOC120659660 [Panicum virgatum]KAG2632401.1 hypothetical protein PVAP13_2NG087900 [Panicum virgatum]KAG2632402.1 hypothetical protein PVAP13_2NG087900 [Panicum virgatum]